MVTAYGTSRAAPTSERLRTTQLYALRSNSMVALFRTRRRLVLRFLSMCAPPFFGDHARHFLQDRLVGPVNKSHPRPEKAREPAGLTLAQCESRGAGRVIWCACAEWAARCCT